MSFTIDIESDILTAYEIHKEWRDRVPIYVRFFDEYLVLTVPYIMNAEFITSRRSSFYRLTFNSKKGYSMFLLRCA